MVGVTKDMASKVMGYNQELDEEMAVVVAQDVINAAWTDFDPINEKTWPKHDRLFLVMCKQFVNPHIAIFHLGIWRCLDYKSSPEITVIEYADPQHLTKKTP